MLITTEQRFVNYNLRADCAVSIHRDWIHCHFAVLLLLQLVLIDQRKPQEKLFACYTPLAEEENVILSRFNLENRILIFC